MPNDQDIWEALLPRSSCLKELGVSLKRFQNEATVAGLSRSLALSVSLEKVSLYDYEIDEAGAVELEKMLAQNLDCLALLDLRLNSITEQGFEGLLNGMKSNTRLTRLQYDIWAPSSDFKVRAREICRANSVLDQFNPTHLEPGAFPHALELLLKHPTALFELQQNKCVEDLLPNG